MTSNVISNLAFISAVNLSNNLAISFYFHSESKVSFELSPYNGKQEQQFQISYYWPSKPQSGGFVITFISSDTTYYLQDVGSGKALTATTDVNGATIWGFGLTVINSQVMYRILSSANQGCYINDSGGEGNSGDAIIIDYSKQPNNSSTWYMMFT